jgi:hypothetical protein
MTDKTKDTPPDPAAAELKALRAEAEELGVAFADQYPLEDLRRHVEQARRGPTA